MRSQAPCRFLYAQECVKCPVDSYQSDDGSCESCPNGADCGRPGLTLATLHAKPRFFRLEIDSKKLYRCPGDERACPGGLGAGDKQLCSDAYKGVACSECRSKFSPMTDGAGKFRCKPCNVASKTIAYVIYTLLLVCFSGTVLWLMLTETGRNTFVFFADQQGGAADDIVGALDDAKSSAGDDGSEDGDDVVEESWFSDAVGRNIGKVKALASFYQIIAAIPAVYGPNLESPLAYRALQRAAAVFMLGFVKLVPTRCLSTTSNQVFYLRGLVATTSSPLVVLLILHVGWRLDLLIHRLHSKDDNKKNLYIEAFLLFMHLALPLLSITSVETLICDSCDAGPGAAVDILRAAPAISCDSNLWKRFVRPYGILCTMMYPIGVPLSYAVLLFQARDERARRVLQFLASGINTDQI